MRPSCPGPQEDQLSAERGHHECEACGGQSRDVEAVHGRGVRTGTHLIAEPTCSRLPAVTAPASRGSVL
jgi:hypothetical protein